MKLIARTLAILAAALAVAGIAFALNQSSGTQSSTERQMPAELAQASSTDSTGSTASPARGPGGEHNESASLFGLVEVAKNLAIIGVIVGVVSGIMRLLARRHPRTGGPRPHAPPA